MLKILFCFSLFLYCLFPAIAQNNTTFDFQNPNYALLEKAFMDKLNTHRLELGLKPLLVDPALQLAAQDQANFQQKKRIVTHDQPTPLKRTPLERVFFVGGNHEQVGENCLSTPIASPTLTYENVANLLFLQWKNSPRHYANMTLNTYTLQGIGFAFSAHEKILYATQVFAKSKYINPFGNYTNTTNNWNVGNPDGTSCNVAPDDEFLASIIGNYLTIHNDSVYEYYRDLEKVKRIVSDEKDGFALDFVLREQFLCAENHNLHGSAVHDGILLRPYFKRELFANNKYAKVGEFLSFLGMVPPQLREKNYSISVILIKNNKQCKYTYPITFPQGKLELVKLKPYWLYYEGSIKPGHYVDEFTYNIPFEQGKTNFNKEQLEKALFTLSGFKPFILSAEIKSYASIEGTREGNIQLQKERAEELLHFVKPYLNSNTTIDTKGQINYDLFRKQVKNSNLSYLATKSDDAIDLKMKNKKFRDSVAQYLPEQRIATIKIKVEVDYNNSTPVEYLHAGLLHRLTQGDSLESRKIYNKLIRAYENGQLPASELCRHEIPLERKFAPLVNNYIAAWCMADSFFTSAPKIDYLMKATALYPESKAFKYNVFLFCLKLWEKKNALLMEPEDLETYITTLDKKYFEPEYIDNGLLNFYLLATPYYHVKRKYANMEKALTVLKAKLETTNIAETDAVKLAKYFNRYFKFDWSTGLLKKYVVGQKNVSVDAFFTFLKTVTLYRSALTETEFYDLMMQAPVKNKKLFCDWINLDDFQLLRDDKIKNIYCKACAN